MTATRAELLDKIRSLIWWLELRDSTFVTATTFTFGFAVLSWDPASIPAPILSEDTAD